MMPRLLSLALCVVACPALAQQYLQQPDIAACLARSAAQCVALGCDGKQTVYWWVCQPLTDGTAAIVIDTTRLEFGAVSPKGPGLNASEQQALQSNAAISAKLPAAVPDIDLSKPDPLTQR